MESPLPWGIWLFQRYYDGGAGRTVYLAGGLDFFDESYVSGTICRS